MKDGKMEKMETYLDQFGVSFFVHFFPPPVSGSGILPVQVKSVEAMLAQEGHGPTHEPGATSGRFHHLGEPANK